MKQYLRRWNKIVAKGKYLYLLITVACLFSMDRQRLTAEFADEIQDEMSIIYERIDQINMNHSTTILQLYLDDEYLVPEFIALFNATFRLETGNGTSKLWIDGNNAGGIKCGATYCVYASKEAGLSALKVLLVQYVKQFGYDLKSIRDNYCGACGFEDLNVFTDLYAEELKRLLK